MTVSIIGSVFSREIFHIEHLLLVFWAFYVMTFNYFKKKLAVKNTVYVMMHIYTLKFVHEHDLYWHDEYFVLLCG